MSKIYLCINPGEVVVYRSIPQGIRKTMGITEMFYASYLQGLRIPVRMNIPADSLDELLEKLQPLKGRYILTNLGLEFMGTTRRLVPLQTEEFQRVIDSYQPAREKNL